MKAQAVRQALRTDLMAQPEPHNAPLTLTLPIPPSINAIYYTGRDGRRHLTTAGRRWKRDAKNEAWIAAQEHRWKLCCRGWIIIELRIWWRDSSRRRDVSNLHKLLADSLEGIIYLDDKQSLLRDMAVQMDRERPRVELKIYQQEEKDECTR